MSDQEVLGSCSVVWFTWVHMHGLLNSIAWGFILPSGVLVARYYRKKESTAWFWAHRILQVHTHAQSNTPFSTFYIYFRVNTYRELNLVRALDEDTRVFLLQYLSS